MKVTIDPDSGFCFGVERAIQIAEAELDAGQDVYCLGEMVHNKVQMDHLKAKGLKVITRADLPAMVGKSVLIRAHGDPPETFQLANKLGITVINATCPIVTKLQQRIKECYISGKSADIQLVIYGKPGHAEVSGLLGNADNTAIVIQSIDDLENIDFSKPVRMFSQTTMDAENYKLMGEVISARMENAGNTDLVINKSVCRQVSGRAPLLRAFAAKHDVIIFVAGKNSANGAYLYNVCKLINKKSYCISNVEDIDRKWFSDVNSVGVSGATSTSGWLIKQIADHIINL